MKKTLTIIFILLASINQSALSASITVAYNGIPPLLFMDDKDQPCGASIIFLNQVFKEMALKVDYVYMPLARIRKSLEENSIDAYALAHSSIANSPNQHYVELAAGYLVNKNNDKPFEQLNISTKKGMPLLGKMIDHKSMIYTHGEQPLQRGIDMMLNDKRDVDAVYSPILLELVYMAKNKGVLEQLKIKYLDVPKTKLYVVFSDEGAEKYLSRFETAQSHILKQTSFMDILTNFIDL